MMSNDIQYCNWTFWEVITRSNKWAVQRDCDTTPLVKQEGHGPYDFDENATIVLMRGDSRNWKAYKAALEPRGTGEPPSDRSKCPNCTRYVNGVNPYDDGQTWYK